MNDVLKKYSLAYRNELTISMKNEIDRMVGAKEKFYLNLVKQIDSQYSMNGLSGKLICIWSIFLQQSDFSFIVDYFKHPIKNIIVQPGFLTNGSITYNTIIEFA
jgi:hypothetical protein